MKIKYKKGNLIDLFERGDFDCIAHQCNTMLTSEFCGGIAQVIFGKYPRASSANNLRIQEVLNRVDLLGTISIGEKEILNGLIFNLYSQNNPGPPSKGIDSLACRLSYLKESLNRVIDVMNNKGYNTLGIPLIASGLAKPTYFKSLEDKKYFKLFILPVIKEVFKFKDIEITIVYLK